MVLHGHWFKSHFSSISLLPCLIFCLLLLCSTGYITSHFTVSPNLFLPGNDVYRLRGVYPDECARMCVEETSFNCLSFDYNKPTRECDMSDTTGSLNGELSSDIIYDYYEKSKFFSVFSFQVLFTLSRF